MNMMRHPLSAWFKFLTFFAVLGTLALSFGDAERPNRNPVARSLIVDATALKVPPGNVDIPTELSLRLTNAWDLNSANDEFGGLSAMYASGHALTFISDKGSITRLGASELEQQWHGFVGPLPFGCGNMANKHFRDTESLAVDPHKGTMWIGFESRNVICRIAARANGGTAFFAPKAMKSWLDTGGAESIARLRDGSMLVFQEVPNDDQTNSEVLHFDRDPLDPAAKITSMRYQPPKGFHPVDAAQLPDGRLLVLNRKFALPFNFTSRLSIVSLPKVKEGALLTGPIIARIDGQGIADNYEALAIDNDGQDLVIWIASDDNFLSIQRTLLLRFVWPGAARLADRRFGH